MKLKRRLKYSNSFNECTGSIGRLICYIRRLDVFINRFKYRMLRKFECQYDKKYIINSKENNMFR